MSAHIVTPPSALTSFQCLPSFSTQSASQSCFFYFLGVAQTKENMSRELGLNLSAVCGSAIYLRAFLPPGPHNSASLACLRGDDWFLGFLGPFFSSVAAKRPFYFLLFHARPRYKAEGQTTTSSFPPGKSKHEKVVAGEKKKEC